MRHSFLIPAALGLTLCLASLTADAWGGDDNKFVVVKNGSSCMLELQPERDMFNVAFTSPTTLRIESSYGFIGGSAVRISFDKGPEAHLSRLDSRSEKRVLGTLSPEEIAAFGQHTSVRVAGDAALGNLYRSIPLAGFEQAYAQFKSCATTS
ncbi:hypothetical protein [Solimonas marina]|uniref:Uncharacterized protein n=1 Tax=Solimonas marina TaxID=2714601 RepID=A0A969WEL7_9GAMM|nr:hypothetical protein [Solimonas marina]NKF24618.1 hypothetical protein [Solimonas marina]